MARYEHFDIRDGRLFIDGEPVSMYSGSYQYWRIDPSLWRDILVKVKGMGFSMIETYMPWSVHETAPGEFDFGEEDATRDVGRFLDICHSQGVRVLARPGPHINAEMTYFGYPERLFADGDLCMRTADGAPVVLPAPPRMFPCPCYHHPRFQAEVATYFRALGKQVAPRLYPDGPVIALQVDNESAKFGRTHPFDADYSEPSVRLYRQWLEDRYGTIDAMNEACHSDYRAFDLVEPPKSFNCASTDQLRFYLDWFEFGEHYVHQSLRSIAGILSESFGNNVPLFHNCPVTFPMTPLDTPGAESFLDWQAVDAYPTREMYQTIRRGMKYTSTVSRLPHLAEFSSGSVYYGLPLGLDDQKFTTWATVMHGVKGINFYMIVERERWYGSPVTRDGKLRDDRYDFYTRFLGDVKRLGLEDMKPAREVLLLSVRDYERMLAGSIVPIGNSTIIGEFGGWASPDLWASNEKHGLSDPVGARYTSLFNFWYRVLSSAGAHFGIGDSQCGPDMFDGYRLVIAPTFEFIDSALQEKLLAFAEGGGTVIVGPRVPELDSSMNRCETLAGHMRRPSSSTIEGATAFGVEVEEVLAFEDGEAGNGGSLMYTQPVGSGKLVHLGLVPGRVVTPEDAAPFVPLADTLMRSAGIEPGYVPADPRVDVSILEGGGRTVVFVANPTDETLETTIEHCPAGGLRDAGNSSLPGTGTSVQVTLEPWSIRLLEPGGHDAGA